MNSEKYADKLRNICGYDNKRYCIKNDCTDNKLCRECKIMEEKNPEAYYHYQNLKKRQASGDSNA